MTLLQVFFVVSGVVILLISADVARRERFNALHFLVFLSVGTGLLVFTFFPAVLDFFGRLFGVQRGADVLVYTSIVFLIYFVLLLLQKTERNRHDTTRLVREMALLREETNRR
jgi:small membrane protein